MLDGFGSLEVGYPDVHAHIYSIILVRFLYAIYLTALLHKSCSNQFTLHPVLLLYGLAARLDSYIFRECLIAPSLNAQISVYQIYETLLVVGIFLLLIH